MTGGGDGGVGGMSPHLALTVFSFPCGGGPINSSMSVYDKVSFSSKASAT